MEEISYQVKFMKNSRDAYRLILFFNILPNLAILSPLVVGAANNLK